MHLPLFYVFVGLENDEKTSCCLTRPQKAVAAPKTKREREKTAANKRRPSIFSFFSSPGRGMTATESPLRRCCTPFSVFLAFGNERKSGLQPDATVGGSKRAPNQT